MEALLKLLKALRRLRSLHTIPAAKALEHLAGALVALDGPTRSPGESRTVQRVTAVTRDDLRASATRSGECSADSLVYLVEFEDGKGSAILAAGRPARTCYRDLRYV